jgi:hypothetical protein
LSGSLVGVLTHLFADAALAKKQQFFVSFFQKETLPFFLLRLVWKAPMITPDFNIGDRVGVKDSADFNHWSRQGVIAGPADAGEYSVKLDDEDAPVPVLRELLVPLAGVGGDEWFAQVFPINGDAPGMKMYFASGAEVVRFMYQFRALELDETIKVHIPPGATDADRAALHEAGAQELSAS